MKLVLKEIIKYDIFVFNNIDLYVCKCGNKRDVLNEVFFDYEL